MVSSSSKLGDTLEDLTAKGTPLVALWISNRTLGTLAKLRAKYAIPTTIVMRAPEEHEHVVCLDNNDIGFFEDVLYARV